MKTLFKSTLFFGLVLAFNVPALSRALDLNTQYARSIDLLMQNLFRVDVAPGAVIAAPSKQRPDYFYHWVRDAALVLEANMDLYQSGQLSGLQRQKMQKFFLDHVLFSQKTQQNALKVNGLGEPKFFVDGQVYNGPWGRPQNDGPALRASSLIRLLGIAIRENWPQLEELKRILYQAQLPAQSIIKADLEYVAKNWHEVNVDLWEEVYGFHFYTLMTQRKAMILGAQIAQAFGDPQAAQYYHQQYLRMNQELNRFWDGSRGYIYATLGYSGTVQKPAVAKNGSSIKVLNKSQLDAAVILGVLHTEINDESFSFADDRVISTFQKSADSFNAIYQINKNTTVAPAWGRYPEDTYDGYQTNSLGNPWVLCTAGAAEYLYRLAMTLRVRQSITLSQYNVEFFTKTARVPNAHIGQVLVRGTQEHREMLQNLMTEADRYLSRVLLHGNPDGSLSEQMNRQSGFMQGAPNLSWSHASVITAKRARDAANKYAELRIKRGVK